MEVLVTRPTGLLAEVTRPMDEVESAMRPTGLPAETRLATDAIEADTRDTLDDTTGATCVPAPTQRTEPTNGVPEAV